MKMQGHANERMKQWCIIEFLHVESIAPVDIHQHLKRVYRDMAVDVSTAMGGLGVSLMVIVG
jgi:hypothetical protein